MYDSPAWLSEVSRYGHWWHWHQRSTKTVPAQLPLSTHTKTPSFLRASKIGMVFQLKSQTLKLLRSSESAWASCCRFPKPEMTPVFYQFLTRTMFFNLERGDCLFSLHWSTVYSYLWILSIIRRKVVFPFLSGCGISFPVRLWYFLSCQVVVFPFLSGCGIFRDYNALAVSEPPWFSSTRGSIVKQLSQRNK